MPWCGSWGTAAGGLWWLLPLIGLVLMGVMFFVCFRGFTRVGRRQLTSGELSDLRQEVESLKEDVRKLARQPN